MSESASRTNGPGPTPGPRVAIVTGGSRGIGAAICRRLGRDGHTVYIGYRERFDQATQVAGEVAAAGGRGVPIQADIAVEAEVAALVNQVMSDHDAVHVLVNNAGITDDRLVMASTLDRWDRVLRTNLTGAFLLSRAVLPPMIDQGWGRIINISSNSVRAPGPGQAAYAAAKGGLEALTRALAAEVGHKGVRINTVAPGTVRTDLTAPVADRLEAASGGIRWGQPEDISGIVAFLASDEADYLQGQTITVDGGRLVSRPR